MSMFLMTLYICTCFVFAGKGKTPVRRGNSWAVSVAASADQTMIQVLERSCEKSCQVTSEQIKADMKAAAEISKKNTSNEITPETEESTKRSGANNGTVWGTGSGERAARPAGKPVTGSGGRVGPGVTSSRQGGSCGSKADQPTHRPNTASISIDDIDGPSGAQSQNSCTREPRISESSGPADIDSLDFTGHAGNHNPRRPAILVGQGDGLNASGGSASAPDSCLQQDHLRNKDFVPRRPLTRSCTRMSSVSLVPETGKIEITIANLNTLLWKSEMKRFCITQSVLKCFLFLNPSII